MNSPVKNQSELREAIASLRPYFRQALGFSVVAGLLALAPSGYMLEVYERVVNSRNHMTLAMLTILVLGAFVLMEVLEWVRAEVLHEAALALDRKLSGRVFRAIFEANLRRLPGGNVIPMNDFRTIREFIHSPVLMAMMESPVALVFLVLIFAISPLLGWFSVVAAILQTIVAWLNERSTKPPLMAANQKASAAQQHADGSLRNAEVIEALGMLHNVVGRWSTKQREFLGLQAKASDHAGFYQAISRFIQNVVASALLGLGAWLVLRNELHGGSAYMIIASILGGRLLAPLVQIIGQWQSVVNARDSFARLESLLINVPPRKESMSLPEPRGMLIVDGVVAAPPGPQGQAPILRGVSLGVAPGEVLAVVGPSASGKTTLARLLVGLWPALSGKVRLDGVDVFTWDKQELGPYVGYLPQGVELFDGSVAENIARFGPVDREKVETAARAVGLHEFILALPEGYETQVGREGARLSGGQRQRVALARALYGKPTYVVLDEPNSSLDEEGDAALAQAISQMAAAGTTFVVMTHRTSVLAVADKMLVLKDGQNQFFGPRDDVLRALKEASDKARLGAAK